MVYKVLFQALLLPKAISVSQACTLWSCNGLYSEVERNEQANMRVALLVSTNQDICKIVSVIVDIKLSYTVVGIISFFYYLRQGNVYSQALWLRISTIMLEKNSLAAMYFFDRPISRMFV